MYFIINSILNNECLHKRKFLYGLLNGGKIVKKNIILLLSMMLILSMFLVMAYVAFFGKEDNAKPELKIKNYLKINIGSEPLTLHPAMAVDFASESVLLQTFEGLTRIDPWGNTVNAIASVIEISDDQKTYWFTLRDTKWTNGETVIAKDFEYAWKWLLDPGNKSQNANHLYCIEGAKQFNEGKGSVDSVGVRAIDNKTLEVKLGEPTSNFLELISLPIYYPVNAKIAQKNPNWANEAGDDYVTNGPFSLTEWTHNNILLSKNNKYWDKDSVKLKTIEMFMVNNPNQERSMYEEGELNWGGISTKKMFDEDEQKLLDDEITKTQSVNGLYSLKLNSNAKPLNNKNIRKSLSLAINRIEVTENNDFKYGIAAYSTIPPWLFLKNSKNNFNENDVNKAREYMQKGLEELGYPDVTQLPIITIYTSNDEKDKSIAESIKLMWKESLDITVSIKSLDENSFNNKFQNQNYEIVLSNSLSDFNDPLYYLESYRNDDSININTGWENKKFQSLLTSSRVEVDEDKRQRLLRKAESLLLEEMPVIPVAFYSVDFVKKYDLKYMALTKTGNNQYKWAYFEELERED